MANITKRYTDTDHESELKRYTGLPLADELLNYYRTMLIIRKFEERVEKAFLKGLVKGTCHACIGQEAVAVGTCAAIRSDDYVVSNHRGHGHFIAKGGNLKKIMAEVFGKIDGYSGGRGGSQHMACFEIGFLGSNGITGGGIPIATGAALAIQLQRREQIVISFMGDGATNQGAFHEALNMAAVWKLPVVYVCENNLYAMSTPFKEAFTIGDIADRANAYSIPGQAIDGNDILAVKKAVKAASERARMGKGPTLIECKTYRFCGHSRGDPRLYRTREEEEQWLQRCPIKRLREKLFQMDVLDGKSDDQIRLEVEQLISETEEFALASPDPSIETITNGLFTP